MTDIEFYHLTKMSLDQAVLGLLKQTIESGRRAVVKMSSEERVDLLNIFLWTSDPVSFLPHGTKKEGNAENQPVWLTVGNENPNRADVLLLTDGVGVPSYQEYGRCLEIFDGNDDKAVISTRTRWLTYKDAGYAPSYWQEDEAGGWGKRKIR